MEEGSVWVEMAPPREPRTPAEVWAGMSPDARDNMLTHPISPYRELAESLDRAAGLTEVFDDEPGGTS
jgi:hypothetical protein